MKTHFYLVSLLFVLLIASCQKETKNDKALLFEPTWELEFISTSDLPFNELFPGKKPFLSFDEQGQVKGNSGCNGYTSKVDITENSMVFGEPGPTTMMYCGEGEPVFRKALKSTKTFEIDENGKLLLKADDKTLLRFGKTEANKKTVEESVYLQFDKGAMSKKGYFSAQGTEPDWNVVIHADSIVFKTMEGTFTMPNPNPIKAMDANVKQYNVETEANTLKIVIIQGECENQMSGEKFPYSVKLEWGAGGITDLRPLQGCGYYNTDYRLNDIWNLQSMNGKEVSRDQYPNEWPSMIIDSQNNTFTGNTGCNNMKGSLYYEPNLLRFKDILTTKKMCPNDRGQEKDFLKALESTTTYTIENNRLTLSNPNGELLVFRKGD